MPDLATRVGAFIARERKVGRRYETFYDATLAYLAAKAAADKQLTNARGNRARKDVTNGKDDEE